jgi:hypothetical protein
MQFSDLSFRETSKPDGIQARVYFDDYELSVIKNEMSYGGSQGLYEIAVYMDDEQVELPGVTAEGDTVRGYLTEEDVNLIMYKMQLISRHGGVQK